MTLAAIYLRLSRNEEQLDIEDVLRNHRETLIKLANQHHLAYDVYQEISSGVNKARPQLNEFLNNLAEYDYLLVMDIDRISRDNGYAEQIKTMLIAHDIKILTPQGAIDLSNESNEMLFSFQAMMANFEYKQIRKRLARGRLAAAEQGRWVMSNRVPLGYKKNEDQKLAIVEEEAKIIRFIFQRTIERMSANEIAHQLDILGWKSRSGKVLTTSHISKIRRNVVYYGVIKACRRVNGRVVDEVFIENAHEPIIPKDQWVEVQAILEELSSKHYFNKRKAMRKLQNLIYCKLCGRKRYIQQDGKGTEYIKACCRKVNNHKCQDRGHQYETVEKFVLQKVKEKQAVIKKGLEKANALEFTKEEKDILEQIESLSKQLDRFEKRMKNLKIMRLDGELTKNEFIELMEESQEESLKVKKKLEKLTAKLERHKEAVQKSNVIDQCLDVLSMLDSIEPEACNRFLKAFIKRVWFSSNAMSNHNTKKGLPEVSIEIEWV